MQYIVYMMFLLVIGLIGLIGNSVSIVVLSKPDMYNCFNQLLITLSTMDSVFIILAMIDYSFNRYVPYFLYFFGEYEKILLPTYIFHLNLYLSIIEYERSVVLLLACIRFSTLSKCYVRIQIQKKRFRLR